MNVSAEEVVVDDLVVDVGRPVSLSRRADLACYETCSLVDAKISFSISASIGVVFVVVEHLANRLLERATENEKKKYAEHEL